jgi:uncharacterized phage protein (TIGR02220 family)
MSGYTYVGRLKNSFICDKRLSGNDIRVYLCLKKWETWKKPVQVETMAKEIGLSRQSFSKSVVVLESLKYIRVERETNWDCNKYHILSKAHVKKTNTDVKKINTNDVKKVNPLISTIVNNKESIKKVSPEEKIPYKQILDYLNEKAKLPRGYKPGNGNNKFISGRWSDGFRLEDFKTVIDVKCKEWLGTSMAQYLRPKTLFTSDNFQSYLNQPVVKEVDHRTPAEIRQAMEDAKCQTR